MEYCFILGRNLLNEARLSIDFSLRKLYHGETYVTSFGDDSVTTSNFGGRWINLVNVGEVEDSLISVEHLRELQSNHRQLQSIVNLVSAGVPVSRIPQNLKTFKQVWSDFVVCDGLLFKK